MDQAFLDEATENAEAFSSTMVELERASDDEAVAMVNDLFRRAHNIKGMAAMEDQPLLAHLAHAAEDLLSRYRDDGGRPTSEQVDALLAAADAMEGMLATLASGGALDAATELEQRLRALAGADDTADPAAGASGAEASGAITWPDDVVGGYRVELVAGTPAPKARARLVLRAAGELADVAGTDPDGLEGLDADHRAFVVAVRGVADEDALLTKLRSFREVHEAAPVELARAAAPPPATPPAPAASASESAPVSTTVRVDVDRLDELLDLVGELVVAKNRVQARATEIGDRPLRELVGALTDVVGELREVVSSVRMVNLEATFTRMQRVARDVARELGKPIELELEGADTELDRSVVDEVMQPLVHLVRNAIDHGVEDQAARVAAGKDETGHVRLRAEQRGPEVVIEVADDGAGIDAVRLAAKAVEKGLISADTARTLSPEQVHDLMFLPGFTSRDQAGLVSGRGVGLDVVRSTVEALGGSIAVRSSPDAGTTFSLHFPVSLVVLDSLLVLVGGRTWALPVTRCEKVVRMDEARSTRAGRRAGDRRGAGGRRDVRGDDRRANDRREEDRRGGPPAELGRDDVGRMAPLVDLGLPAALDDLGLSDDAGVVLDLGGGFGGDGDDGVGTSAGTDRRNAGRGEGRGDGNGDANEDESDDDGEPRARRWSDLPVIRGDQALGRSAPGPLAPFGVVVRESSGRYVLSVDRLVGRAEVVVKPAPRDIPGTDHIAGVTVLAAGHVALVPDLALVLRRAVAAGELKAP